MSTDDGDGGTAAGAEEAPAPVWRSAAAQSATAPPELPAPATPAAAIVDPTAPAGAARIIPLGQSGAGGAPTLFEEMISEDSFYDAMVVHARSLPAPMGWNEWQQLASQVKEHYDEARTQAAAGAWVPWVRSIRYAVNDAVHGSGWRSRYFEKSHAKRVPASGAAPPGDGGASVSVGAAGAGDSPER